MGQRHPFADQRAEILHLGIAAGHAEQHRGQLALLGVALEQDRDLAADEQLVGTPRRFLGAFGAIAHAAVLLARARAGEVEQIDPIEERPASAAHGDGELGHERAEHAARQALARAVAVRSLRHHRDQVAPILGRAQIELHAIDIDDAALARSERVECGMRRRREAQALQAAGE